MKFVIETNLASQPSWWLVDNDDQVLAWAGTTYISLAIRGSGSARLSGERRRPRLPGACQGRQLVVDRMVLRGGARGGLE